MFPLLRWVFGQLVLKKTKKKWFQVVRNHGSYIYFKLAWQKKTWHVAKQSWRMTIKTSIPTEDHQLWRLQQWWSLEKRHFAGAALKFCSWQSSLQVRKETSSGIRHFSYRACLQAEPSISKSLIHLIPTHLFMPYDDLLHDEDRYSRSDVTTEEISSEPSQNLTKPLIK